METYRRGDIWRQWINVVALLLMLAVNGLANALPFNGLTTGEISDRFDVYFVPAAYVFSIWGLIYIALIAFVVYQALPSQRQNPRLRRIGYLFALSCVANALWLVMWHYLQLALSVLVMLVLLLCLIAIYLRLGIGRGRVSPAERWLVRAPFSLYLGWITVATVANVTAYLSAIGWSGWGVSAQVWAAIMIGVGWLLATAMAMSRRDVIYGLVIIWAYIGIAIKFPSVPLVGRVAWIVAALIAVELIAVIFLYTDRTDYHRSCSS